MNQPASPSLTPVKDAGPVALIVLGFTLAVTGVGFAFDPTAMIGIYYAILVGGFAMVITSMLCLSNGLHYPGYINGIIGCWLIGLFLLLTFGADDAHFTNHATGWYALLMAVPSLILTIPAYLHRDNIPFMIAAPALTLLFVTMGLADLTGPHALLLNISGGLALLAAICVWFAGARMMLENVAPAHVAGPGGDHGGSASERGHISVVTQ